MPVLAFVSAVTPGDFKKHFTMARSVAGRHMADYENTEPTSDSEGEPDPSVTVTKEDAAILKESRECLTRCIEDEQDERQKMMDDIHFATLDQWPEDVRAQRENDSVNGSRPCLTIDQINQYTTQVSNDMRQNRPSIKTRPVDDQADVETAKIFQGLVRHIEDQSSASIAYQTAGESAVDIGLGFFRIITDYVDSDSFDQEILIKRVPDTFSVYLSAHQMPDGSDAEKGWILEKVPVAQFKANYPKAKIDENDFSGLGVMPTWKTDQTVTVCEYFYKKYSQDKLLYLADGSTILKGDFEKLPEEGRLKITGQRDCQRVTVKWCKHSGAEVLEKRDWPGKYIPIVEEVGKEKIVDGKRVLWGLVRPAKDSLRAFNYWISAMTEKMALAPKAPFVGAVGQFASQGDKWDKANINNYAKLEYDPVDVNGNAVPAPQRQQPTPMEPAMAQMLQIMQNNVKSSLGMYKASVGQGEGDQSGRAILALKKESDTGTLHFGDNQAISITHGGRIIVDLIPKIYDTRRVLRILGEDGKVQNAMIDPELSNGDGRPIARRDIAGPDGKVQKIYNLGVGKYDVTITVGPGYTTSRQEAATVMTELANSAKDPISAAIMRYGAVKNSDFHGSEEVTRMLKAMLPPQLQQPDDGTEIPPVATAKIGQLTQQIQGMQQQGQELMQENQQLKSGAAASMEKVNADKEAKGAQATLDRQVAEGKMQLAREEFEFKKQLDIDVANHEIAMDHQKADATRKAQAQNEQSSAMPKFVEVVAEIGQAISESNKIVLEAVSAIVKTQAEIVEALNKPQTVTIGNVKYKDGHLVGAEATKTVN